MNLFEKIPEQLPEELIEVLHRSSGVRIERIVSRGHATAPGSWYDQRSDEWVLLLAGSAALQVEGKDITWLKPGDVLFLPAHQRHRVESSDPATDTIWLAIHLNPE